MKNVLILMLYTTLLNAISANDELVTGDYYPFVDSHRANLGTHSDLVRRVFKELNWKFEPKFYPWNRSRQMLESGEAYYSYSWFKTKEREKYLIYTKEPIEEIPVFVYFNKKKITDLKKKIDITSLKNFRSVVINGYWQEEFFKENGISYTVVPSTESLWLLLADERVDFVISSSLSAEQGMAKIPRGRKDHILKMQVPLKRDNLYFVVSKKAPNALSLAQKWDKKLKELKQTLK